MAQRCLENRKGWLDELANMKLGLEDGCLNITTHNRGKSYAEIFMMVSRLDRCCGPWFAAVVLLFLMFALEAHAEDSTVIQVDPQTAAKVTLSSDRIVIRLMPGKNPQMLKIEPTDAENGYRMVATDFNFDGHQDFAIVDSYDGVTEGYQIFLFDPSRQRFAPLHIKDGGACAGLSSVTVDARSHALYSACRGASWSMDAYRYGADGRIYLYQTTEESGIEGNSAIERLLGVKEVDAAIGRLITYDEEGRVVGRGLAHRDDLSKIQAAAHVSVNRLALQERPRNAPSKRYLIRGDGVKIEDLSDDGKWVKVTFQNSEKGSIQGWVAVDGLSPQ
ncbi:FG-GAP repeat protein [Burkholderia vietnamiensis]|uniref:FG-GAP repeat protein n=1 Tax=Burkholderia vietnamiensis TaxID=60552 RepID=UPI001BADFE8D|nr:FG-GAP repeat protein [Burkholderia vietnamiensis]